MSFLPVVERELRVVSRNPRFYWARFAAALIAFALIAWIFLLFTRGTTPAEQARQIFGTLTVFCYLYCILAGLFTTADCISEEKREGTLGLLFLTNLKGYDIVLGKLVANSVSAFYGLIAVFPILSFPLLLGGLNPGEFVRTALALLLTLLLSLSVCLLVSTLSKNDRKAQFAAFLLLLFLSVGLPFIHRWIHNNGPIVTNPWIFLFWASPSTMAAWALERNYTGNGVQLYWLSFSTILAISLSCLLLSAVVVKRIWRDRPRIALDLRLEKWLHRQRGTPKQKRFRQTLLDVNPIYWLGIRHPLKTLYLPAFLLLTAILWLLLLARNPREMLESEPLFITTLFLHTAIKIWLASEAGRRFFEDRSSGALELTLSTPLKVREIVEGQFFALVRQFGWAIAVILVFDIFALIIGGRRSLQMDEEWFLTCLAAMILLVVDAFTIAVLGMWQGLSRRRSSIAFLHTAFSVLILPWLVFIGVLTFVALARLRGIDSALGLIGTYFLISLAFDFWFFFTASNNLMNRFREVATQRFDK